jgi:hypothetical protein
MRRLIVAMGCLLGGAAAAACSAGDEGEPGLEDEYLLGGQIDPGHRFAVGFCAAQLQPDGSCPVPGTPGTARCSGTLVAPNLVLTARHCVEEFAPGSPDFCAGQFTGVRINPEMQITTGDTVLQKNNTWHKVSLVVTPPGNNNCTDDIALLVLRTRVRDVAPAGVDFRRNVVTSPPAALAIVGRGAIKERYNPETFERVEFDNGNILRRVLEDIPFVCAPEKTGDCTVVDFWSSPPTFSPPPGIFAYGPSGGVGDSGAGVFDQEQFSAGTYRVIGVNTLGTMAADGNSSGSEAVRLDRHVPILRLSASQAAAAVGDPVADWAR